MFGTIKNNRISILIAVSSEPLALNCCKAFKIFSIHVFFVAKIIYCVNIYLWCPCYNWVMNSLFFAVIFKIVFFRSCEQYRLFIRFQYWWSHWNDIPNWQCTDRCPYLECGSQKHVSRCNKWFCNGEVSLFCLFRIYSHTHISFSSSVVICTLTSNVNRVLCNLVVYVYYTCSRFIAT